MKSISYRTIGGALILLMLSNGVYTSAQQTPVKLTEAHNNVLGIHALFMDTDDAQLKQKMYLDLKTVFENQVFVQKNEKTNELVGPIVLMQDNKNTSGNEPFMSRSKAGRDILIGAALCGGGCLIVNVAGKKSDPENPPSGLVAKAGDKEITGGGACLVGAVWITGLGFMAKGFFELLMQNTKPANSSYYQTDEMIKHNHLAVQSEKTVMVNDINTPDMREIVAQAYLLNNNGKKDVFNWLVAR